MKLFQRLGFAFCAAAGLLFVAALPVQNTIPSVANTTALRATPTTAAYSGVVLRVTDGVAGAPPLVFLPGTSACSTDDGASCVDSSDGKSWVGQFPSTGADLRQWGVSSTATDNTTALRNALCTSGLTNFSIPPGTYKFASAISCTLSATGVQSYKISGAGSDVSNLEYDGSTGTALTLTCGTTYTAFHFRDFTIQTNQAGGATGLAISCLAANSDEYVPFNDITNVSFRGADGYAQTDYWTTGYSLTDTTQWNLTTYCTGAGHGSGYAGASNSGTCAALAGASASLNGVVFNFIGSTFNLVSAGISYGSDIQGVTVSQSNFTGCYLGVLVPSGGASQDELTIENGNQFNCAGAGVQDNSGINALIATGNLLIVPSGAIGFDLEKYYNFTIADNHFNAVTNAAGTGVKVNVAIGGTNSIVDRNILVGLGTGITITSSATTPITLGRGNRWASVTTPIVNNVASVSFANTVSILGAPAFGIISSASLSNDSGFLEGAFSSTAGYYTGQWVLVEAINPTTPQNSVTTPSQITVSGSNIIFANFGYSSGYSNVNIAPLP